MKAIPYEARTKNVDGHDDCRWCASDGYVTVAIRPAAGSPVRPECKPRTGYGAYDEMAPCPFCQAGYREEFPVPRPGNPRPTKPPWGDDGYWRGRDVGEVVTPLYPAGSKPLSKDENRRRWRDDLGSVLGRVAKDIPWGEAAA